ncbi:hypothetical protein ACFL4L_00500 [bacterium]
MLNPILFYTASVFILVWGIAHLFPTKSVVKGFGDISVDNQRIITMEWIVEGAALIFMGLLVACVTYVDYAHLISKTVYWLSIIMLNILSVISLLTGFKVNFAPFKLCPIIFTTASILIVLGVIL